jgi:N4-gp56 family major capsid protein
MHRHNPVLDAIASAPAMALVQAFTNMNLNLTTSAATGNNLSALIKTYYDPELLANATPNLVHRQFGIKKSIPQGGGKSIEFRRFTDLPVGLTPLSEGVTPNGLSLDVAALIASIAQYGNYVSMSDLLQITAFDPVISEATRLLGYNAGMTLDTLCRNVLLTGTNVAYAPKGDGTAVTSRATLAKDSVLTVEMVDRAATILRMQNAPAFPDGKYVAIAHPAVIHDLMTNARDSWLDASKYVSLADALSGEVGACMGVRFVQSTQAKAYAAASADSTTVFATLFLGQRAYGVIDLAGGGLQTIVKQLGSGGADDPLNQRSSVGWKAAEATCILQPSSILRVESCSPAFPGVATN